MHLATRLNRYRSASRRSRMCSCILRGISFSPTRRRRNRKMSEMFLQAATLWQREVVRFIRQPIRVMSAILTPLVFWLLLGAGLQASFKPSGMPAGSNYAQYFYPGVIVLMLVFTAIFATASTVDDRRQGFLQG